MLSPTQLQLRAEQAVSGGARVYTVRVTCTDGSANAASKMATVTIAR